MGIKGSIELGFGTRDKEDFDLSTIAPPEREISGEKPRFCELHWHECFELLYVKTGRRELTLDGESFSLTEGDVAVIPPRMTHSTYDEPQWGFSGLVYGYTESVIYTPELSLSNLRYLSDFRKKRPTCDYILRGDRIEPLRAALLRGEEIFATRDPLRSIKMRANILEVHSILCEMLLPSLRGSSDSRFIAELREYIEEQLPEDISPYRAADALHVSHSHLCRVVKGELGMTISELIASTRIGLAEQLLLTEPQLSITECAAAVGYSDTSYFIRRFRQHNGISPGEFKRNNTMIHKKVEDS